MNQKQIKRQIQFIKLKDPQLADLLQLVMDKLEALRHELEELSIWLTKLRGE